MTDNGHRAKVPENAINITLSGQKCKLINGRHPLTAALITEDEAWRKWKGQMPVIYSKGFS
jgi:hypothetical protein